MILAEPSSNCCDSLGVSVCFVIFVGHLSNKIKSVLTNMNSRNEQAVEWLALLLLFREVLSSNSDKELDCSYVTFLCISRYMQYIR
jgi:hypothetical protein